MVGKQNSFVAVDGENAFNHSPQNRFESLAILSRLTALLVELANAI